VRNSKWYTWMICVINWIRLSYPLLLCKLHIWKHVIFSFWTISQTKINFASITVATDAFISGFGLGISSEQMKLSRFPGYDWSDMISDFIKSCSIVSWYQRFDRTCWFHLQRRRDWGEPSLPFPWIWVPYFFGPQSGCFSPQRYAQGFSKGPNGIVHGSGSSDWVKKVKFSPLQALESLRVVRGWGSHIFEWLGRLKIVLAAFMYKLTVSSAF
jgi:hypothetical protein